MHRYPNSDPEYLDDTLARFADQLMQGESGEGLNEADGELANLQATARQVKTLFEASRPGEEVAQRLHANLARGWKLLGYDVPRPSAWPRLRELFTTSQPGWQSSRRQRRAYAFSLASLAGLVLIFALVVQAAGVDISPGAILEDTPLAVIGAILVGGLGVLVWWLLARRR